MPNLYATVAALDERLGGQTAGQEFMLIAIIEAVSRQIDHWTGRHFYVQEAAKTFTPSRPDRLLVPDLLAVTSLATDSAGDLSYATTWDASDYVLLPSNAPLESPPHPYGEVRPAAGASQSFTPLLEAVRIVGRWGFSDLHRESIAELTNGINPSEEDIEVMPPGLISAGMTLLVDDEQIYVRGVVNDLLHVFRGVNGTSVGNHNQNELLYVYTYPIISEACLLQAAHLYQSTQAPGGVLGGGDFGPVRFAALQPLARAMLLPFKLPGLASYGD